MRRVYMRFLLRSILRSYQLVISPLLPFACRFTPSCSHYAAEAVEAHGAAKGSWLTLRRLLRCHPFGTCGHDPVPPSTKVTTH